MFDSPETDAQVELTDRQQAVLDVIRQHAAEHGYPPTVREIGARLGLTSSSTVHAHLAALERAGVLQRDPTKPRALKWDTVTPGGSSIGDGVEHLGPDVDVEAAEQIPVVGRVAAGAPILAEEHVEQVLPVPRMLTKPGRNFLLKVRGDSMIEAGILDGDLVIVRQQPDATDGQIVIAMVDGEEATCKVLRRQGGRVVLEPANSTMEPIVPDDCQIVGIVTGVMRSIDGRL
jgi:repressor LexA